VDSLAIVVIAVLGIATGVLAVLVWHAQRPDRVGREDSIAGFDGGDAITIAQVLAVLPGATMVVDGASGVVQRASAKAVSLGLVVSDRLASIEIQALVGEVHRDGITREHDVVIRRPALARAPLELRVRAAALGGGAVLVLAEDLSGARRVDTVRRDFVANVSHELKTPVGALMLLSEAVAESADDRDAVRAFAGRMSGECRRLTNLVGDLIDLSRLQGDQPLESARPVSVDAVVAEAVDSVRTAAARDEIEVAVGGEEGLRVFGVEDQLVTALRNLIANAISYSKPQTRVAVGTSERDGIVNITVSDQGIGIPPGELERVFERFYRIDPARSRITGGTGLGLAIVKHVCNNHGGDVTVWSVEGEGSTFTLRLPAYRGEGDSHPANVPHRVEAL
jgi:two-component system sensor histidine kinase SenX3